MSSAPVPSAPIRAREARALQASLMPLAADAPLQPAGFVSRLVALILDIIFVTVGALVFAALVSLILNFFGVSTGERTLDASTRNIFDILQTVIVVLSGLAVLLFVPGYFVVSWVLTGATPGKQILGLRVVRTSGQPVGGGRAIIRYLGYFISAIVLFLGFLWVLVDRRRQAWHDKFADTVVVYRWKVPPDA